MSLTMTGNPDDEWKSKSVTRAENPDMQEKWLREGILWLCYMGDTFQ